MSNVDRRTVTKGVAWTLPAITTAAVAPSLAASSTPTTTLSGYAHKCPGNSDVPGGWPKHGYMVVLSITPTPQSVVPVSVLLGNKKYATIKTDATFGDEGWEFVIDANSSPSKMTVTVLVDGEEYDVSIKSHPHCP